MSLFAPLAGASAACLALTARLFAVSPATLVPADQADDRAGWLQARMLGLVAGLAIVFGCFYSLYFLSIGFYVAVWIGPVCVLASVGTLRYARASGRYCRAIDILSTLLFAMVALITLFQDGIHSPALWWLGVPAIGALIAGRVTVGVVLSALFVAQAALLYWLGPGSIGPISLLTADPALQMAMSMSLSAVFVALCAALGSHWGGELRRALEFAREAAVAASAARARFVTEVSHEIRAPLQGMIGATEMLRQPALPEARRASLVEVQRQSAEVLMDLVNDVLDFSKLDAGKVVLERRPLHLAALVREVEAFFAPEAFVKGIELVSTCSPDVPEMIIGDSTRIRQIVANLVANAIKFTATGGVHIHLGLDGEAPLETAAGERGMRLRIQVADSGVGIDPSRLPFLFKPFHQADESIGRRFGGTGLGLSIADDLARLMGGRIEATSAVARGSTFTLVMPLVLVELPAGFEPLLANGAAARNALPAAGRPDPQPAPESSPLAGRTVLVAEDDTSNQAVVVAMLETLQVRSLVAATGHEALACLAAHSIDAVLMDVQMPGLDGLSATRAWRKRSGSITALPFVAMTGKTDPDDLAACRAAGMSAILTKPFAVADLQRALVQAIEAAKPASPPL